VSLDELSVFIVDDDASVRAATARLLSSVGISSRAFPDVESFLEAVETQSAGCFILEVRLRGHSGLDLQRELLDRGHASPVVFVTAHADVRMAVRAMKAGALEVLTKPVYDQSLLDAVHGALAIERDRRRRAAELDRLRARFDALTVREREVLELVVEGQTNKLIATSLGTTEKTVKAHRGHVMRKMQAQSLVDLVRMSDRLRAGDRLVTPQGMGRKAHLAEP
jgi:FixJ family two-component response regulator